MQSFVKYKKYFILHILTTKKLTSVGVKLCINAQCITAIVTMHIYIVTVTLAFDIYFFSLSTSLSLFLSGLTLTSRSLFLHWFLLLSKSRHSRAIADHLTHCCSRWSSLPHRMLLLLLIVVAIFFLGLMVLGFWLVDFDGSLLSRVSPQPITSLIVAHADRHYLADRRCSRRLPLLSFFFVWWFWDFDQWILMVLISGFDDFD